MLSYYATGVNILSNNTASYVGHGFRLFNTFLLLGVENGVTSIPSHSEPDMRLSPHPAPSLDAHCHWCNLTFCESSAVFLS